MPVKKNILTKVMLIQTQKRFNKKTHYSDTFNMNSMIKSLRFSIYQRVGIKLQ